MPSEATSAIFANVLLGRTALVTGGDSGIGAACAKALAAAGADVAVTYLHDEQGAAETAEAVRAHGRRALAMRSDARDEHAVEECFDRIEQELGTVDILVTSAGINTYGIEVAKLTLDKWEDMLRTDLTGTFLATRSCTRRMQEQKKKGAVIAISSIHAEIVRSGSSVYAAAKAGVKHFIETLAIEVAGDGITVNAIAPGMILTPMNQTAEDWWVVRKVKSEFIPLGRPGQPEEVANCAVFLASPAGDYITASTLTIDGGLSKMVALGA
ncbi:SDR family NAD(P)-dependent oxidoreductase [Sphingomonas nostoxanthinifaciens]|uniref:SDR family NAD(P)-dependent oxidoreductase n=1 Tax=Sphingomonas nostoxanthinifaciens TaxID=2872652 RepID=UPI001CC1D241|nr:SDR family oxidoreductase [Sphingomonas nostoxanthinifaciens]UAK23866.1 SDR family oxidoreductase [Sphingomonas nostoxanthinifaciens]